MRLYQVGLALIFAAVLIPIIAIILTALSTQPSGVTWGGAILVFPIPIAIVMGNKPTVVTALSWVMLAVFVILLVLFIVTLLRSRGVRPSDFDTSGV
jgi:uncharacterized membrane protein